MVSSFARWLVRMQCYNLSGTFLSIASKIIGKGFRITYNKDGFWRHAKGDMVINEAFPNIRMDPGHIRKEVQISFYDYEPKEKDICIDIGAGIGTECISTSKMIGPLGRIYAVEASPFIYKILETNVLENSLNNVSCYNLAIGDQNGKIKISDNLNDHIVNNIWGSEGVDVDARTMDDFISFLGLKEIDFLRVNIEGAEKLLISKFANISNTRRVAIACHDFLTRRSGDPQFTTKKKVSDFLTSNDFLIKSSNTGVDYIDDWVYGVNKKFLTASMQRSDK
jgi:FkbM family methyltransferase